jgi:hypothetical protein
LQASQLENRLFHPPRLWTRAEALARECPIPSEPGVYAWFFKEAPPGVPLEGCLSRGGAILLYLGIAPSRPGSRSNLRKRLRGHLRGNASGSTLRLSLGCLLAGELGIELRRVGRTQRLTFSEGEAKLSTWLEQNALLAWVEVEEPWRFEEGLIRATSLPLNLELNAAHPFHARLHAARHQARERARRLPALPR